MTRRRSGPRRAEGFLTPSQFAFHTDTPLRELARLHANGTFRAKVAGGLGRGNQRFYAEDQVETFLRFFSVKADASTDAGILRMQEQAQHARTAATANVPFTGDQAQRGFQALAAGKELTQMVLEEGLHPDIAVSIANAWAKMRGGVFVDKSILDAIALLPLTGPIPIVKAADLLEVLRLAVEETSCTICAKNTRVACKRCVQQAIFKARQEEREKAQTPAPEAELAAVAAE